MFFTCDKATLLNGINIVSKALPTKSINPVYEGILFNLSDNKVMLTSTDSSLTIQTKLAAEVSEPDSVVINGRFFSEVIRRMPDGMIKVKGNLQSGIEVSSNNTKINIAALNPEEYPSLPVIDKETFFITSQGEFKKMVNQTIFATAQDESRPILTGCLFDIENDKITVVALDGCRLSLRNSFINNVEIPIKAIIPARALSEITKILSDSDDEAKVYIQKSYCMVEIEETKIITRLIEGEFVKYKPIIPQNMTNSVIVNRIDLLEAIDRAWLIVRENVRNNYILFKFNENKLIITSRSDTGNAYEEVNIQGTSTPIEIGVNPKYFVECLKNIEDEFIKFSYTTPTSPTVTTPVDGDKYLYLILPVRL